MDDTYIVTSSEDPDPSPTDPTPGSLTATYFEYGVDLIDLTEYLIEDRDPYPLQPRVIGPVSFLFSRYWERTLIRSPPY